MATIELPTNTAVVVPVNILQLTDDTDYKTIETSVVYNAAGMTLKWNFVTPAGVQTQTAVTPTTSGLHDWANLGGGMYSLEIPSSGGTINNNAAGYGWFTGVATGVLPFASPIIVFKPALIIDSLINGTDKLQVDVKEVNGTSQTAGDLYAKLTSLPADTLDLVNGVETSVTLRQALRLILAASAGKVSGAGTTTIVIRNVGDSKDRITATVDSDGNRSAVTLDVT